MNTLPVRYAGWMARDLARGPGLVMLIVTVLAVRIEMVVNNVALFDVNRVSVVFVLLATAGIVSKDTAGGYHRLLFAKPVSPPFYYLLRWSLGAAAVLLAVFVVDLGLSERFHIPMTGPNLFARAGLLYLLLGSLVFLLSTVTRHDWLIAALLLFSHWVIGYVRSIGFWSNSLASMTYTLLPPFHLVGAAGPVTWGPELAHVALYGITLLLGAMAMLCWRPLGAGRRE